MRRLFFSIVTMAIAMVANALVINNTAGALESNTSDKNITSLTVTGTIDARDFKFIADSLSSLESLDLGQAQIVAYSDSLKPLVGTTFRFYADELPPIILMGCELREIILPTNLLSLGQASLAGCRNITSITLPETLLRIDDYALSGTGITSITVPQSVVKMGEGAFSQCHDLATAQLNTAQVPAFTFMGDTLLSDVTLGNKVTDIGQSAFNGCTALQTIKVDENNAIKTIGAEAFIGSGMQGMDLSKLPLLETIGNWAFANSGITNGELPQNVTTLGDGAFFYAQNLANATLPQGINTIPDYSFAGASNITNGELIPNGTTSVGQYAFYNLDKVSVFTIPASVSYMGSWAMAGMTGLDTINALPIVVPELGENVWAGIDQPAVKLSTENNDVADLYQATDQWKEFHVLRYYLMGDVNMDGRVNITDVNATIAHIMNNPVDPFNFQSADMNNDGIINITDVNAIINYILNNIEDYYRKVKGLTYHDDSNNTTDGVSINDFTIEPGQTRTIELMLNSRNTYNGVQFSISLPEGLSIVPGTLMTTANNDTFNYLYGEKIGRILGYSSRCDFLKNEGAIMKFDVIATDDLAQQSSIEINEVIFSDGDFHSHYGYGCYALVNSSTTGVDDIAKSNNKVYAYDHTLVIEAAECGTAQIVAMNGVSQNIEVTAGHTQVELPGGFYVVRLAGKSYKITIK